MRLHGRYSEGKCGDAEKILRGRDGRKNLGRYHGEG
jgi:hypothetical protein